MVEDITEILLDPLHHEESLEKPACQGDPAKSRNPLSNDISDDKEDPDDTFLVLIQMTHMQQKTNGNKIRPPGRPSRLRTPKDEKNEKRKK